MSRRSSARPKSYKTYPQTHEKREKIHILLINVFRLIRVFRGQTDFFLSS